MINFRDKLGVINAAGNEVVLNVEDAAFVGAMLMGTFNGGQVDFTASIDGQNFVAIKDQFGTNSSSATQTGAFTFKVSGFKAIKVSGHSGLSGGNINVTLHAVSAD